MNDAISKKVQHYYGELLQGSGDLTPGPVVN